MDIGRPYDIPSAPYAPDRGRYNGDNDGGGGGSGPYARPRVGTGQRRHQGQRWYDGDEHGRREHEADMGNPNDSVPKNAMGHCSLHNKQRCLDCLEYSASTGQYVCMADHQCKSSAPNMANVVCMQHNKRRTPGVLIDDGSGFLRCASEQRCKGGNIEEDHVPQHQPHVRNPLLPCSQHNKMRTQHCLVSDGMGGHRCMQGEECRVRSPPAEPPSGFGMCSIHGSFREWEYLLHDGMGGYMCAEDNVCPVAEMRNRKPARDHRQHQNNHSHAFNTNEQGLCSAHRKTRSVVCLQEDGNGGYQCKQDMECKTTSDRYSDGPQRRNQYQGHHQQQQHHHQHQQQQHQGHQQFRNHDDPNFRPELRPDLQLCFIHHKYRKLACMVEDENGNWICAPEMKCKGVRADFNGDGK